MDESIRFGRFELRLRARELRADDAPVALGGRAFDLLVALIERRERVASRAELADLVWGDRVVEDNNLAVQVLALRRALGPDAIVTVPGRGYRFALPLDGEAGGSPAAAPPPAGGDGAPCDSGPPPALEVLHGRESTLAVLDGLLDAHRLVTVAGPGGIGKSTFAAAVLRARAARTPGQRVAWVELGELADPARVAAAVGRRLGIPTERTADPVPALAAALRREAPLIALDGCEHLVGPCAALAAELIRRAPGVRIVATSQVPLKVEGERVLRLDGLELPPERCAADAVGAHPAVAMFLDRWRAAGGAVPDDEASLRAVAGICRDLDGIPLAIELAASRAASLGIEGLARSLALGQTRLGGGRRHAPTRQQTLRATLEWSHDLLAPPEQAVFRRLGVFVGGFRLDDARAVAADGGLDARDVDEHLATLVDRSLVAAQAGAAPRYRMLANAREHALERLADAGETGRTRRAHARAIAEALREADESLWTSTDDAWLARWVPELDNVRAAIAWSLPDEPTLATALLGRAGHLFDACSVRHEFRRLCEALEAARPPGEDDADGGRYWLARATSLNGQDHVAMHACARRAERVFDACGDARGLYLANCLLAAGAPPVVPRDPTRIERVRELGRRPWPARVAAWGAFAEAVRALEDGDADAARRAAVGGRQRAEAAGAEWHATMLADFATMADLMAGRTDDALREAEQLVARMRVRPNGFQMLSMGQRAHALLLARRLDDAREALAEMFDWDRAADWDVLGWFAPVCILLPLMERRLDDAARLVGHAARVLPAIGADWPRTVEFRERVSTSLRAALGEAAFAMRTAEGAALDPEGVVAATLGPRAAAG